MPKKEKPLRLIIYLLKQEIKKYAEALKDRNRVEIATRSDFDFEGIIITENSFHRAPQWKADLTRFTADPLDSIFSASASALLMITSGERIFAIPFGYGRKFLNEDSYERRFGLIVALNTVDPTELRSIDAQKFDAITLNTAAQTSKNTDFFEFGMDIQRDIMRAVTGRPRDLKFAQQVSGRDALALTVELQPEDLEGKLKECLKHYSSNVYKKNFPFIDNLSPEKDKSKQSELNDYLVGNLKKSDLDKIHLCFPENINWDNFDGVRYSGEPREIRHPDIDVEEYLPVVDINDLSIKTLKRNTVSVYSFGGSKAVQTFSIFNCINCEIDLGNDTFILSNGEWFRAATDYVKTLNDYADGLDDKVSIDFPSTPENTKENDYNLQVEAENPNEIKCLDGILIAPFDGTTRIEACDLFSISGEFIHVKRRTRSSSLSHLFAQGANSAQNLLRSEKFRTDLQQKLPGNFAKLIPTTNIDPVNFKIVYAIITKSKKSLRECLPFFSRQTLFTYGSLLQSMRFSVVVVKIIAT